jgi:AbrB family looped-hinge helix DNA binding protein
VRDIFINIPPKWEWVGIISEAIIDSKGRIMLPKKFRKRMDLDTGKRVKINLQEGRIVITSPVEPELFAKRMRGFIREGSGIKKRDPIELKKIWEGP